MTEVILSRLGYQILLPENLVALRSDNPELRPDLRLVDDRRFEDVPAATDSGGDGAIPIILLTGVGGSTIGDPRIVGATKRPAGLHDLYRLMQLVFEDIPRSTPRVATHLAARYEHRGVKRNGRVLSISENGCLIRSPEAILLGQRLQLEIVLPRSGPVTLEAEATYKLLPDTGLVFSSLASSSRENLARFVSETILS